MAVPTISHSLIFLCHNGTLVFRRVCSVIQGNLKLPMSRQPSPARAPSPARGGKDGGGEGRSEGTSPPRSRYRLSINKGRLSPVITVMRGIRRIRRSASTGRTARRDDDHEDEHNSSQSKFPSRLPFFHGHPPTGSASQGITRPPSHDAPHPDLPPPPSRPSQSDASSSASPTTPPLPLSPIKKKPHGPAHAQPRPQPSPSVSRSPTPPKQPERDGVPKPEKRHETQTMFHQQHGDDNRMSYASRFRLHKGLSGLDQKSLDSMDQIKKDIMEMRTHRRKVKFMGNDWTDATTPHADAHDGESASHPSKLAETSLNTFKSPQPQSRASFQPTSTPTSGIQRYHSKSSSGTPKRKMGLGEITMRKYIIPFATHQFL